MAYSTDQLIKLNDVAYEYRDKIYRSIYTELNQPKLKNTGAGLASLTVTVDEGNANRSPAIIVNVDQHIFRLESRGMQWTKLPNMKKLLEWAEHKKPGDPKAAKALAWGTAMDKKKNDTWKPKRWRRKSLSATLKDMNKELLAAFDRAIQEEMNKAIAG
jgi:hypothetical protein